MNQEEFDNQSLFNEVSQNQAPPETLEVKTPTPEEVKATGKRKKILGLGFGGLLILVFFLVWSVKFFKPVPQVTVTPTATPIPVKQFTTTDVEVARLEEIVKLADPSDVVLAPPPVEEKLEF